MSQIENTLRDFLSIHPPEQDFCIAFSGGVDSTVLLHALSQQLPLGRLRAIHINHQWHPDAPKWAEHCQSFCQTRHIPLLIETLSTTRPSRSESLEAYARKQREACFEKILRSQEILLSAHHRDDQLETLLYKLCRGAGPEGLSGVRSTRPLGKGILKRPFLFVSREAILSYAKEQALDWIEDPSNQNQRFDRNWNRHTMVPALKERFSGVEQSVAQTAERCHSMSSALHALVQMQFTKDTLTKKQLESFEHSAQLGILRAWLQLTCTSLPSWRQLKELHRQLIEAKTAALVWDEWQCQLWQQTLYILPKQLPSPPKSKLSCSAQMLPMPEADLTLSSEKYDLWYWNDMEGFKGSPSRHHLKNQFQKNKIPPWVRPYVPLVFVDNHLALPIEKAAKLSKKLIQS